MLLAILFSIISFGIKWVTKKEQSKIEKILIDEEDKRVKKIILDELKKQNLIPQDNNTK